MNINTSFSIKKYSVLLTMVCFGVGFLATSLQATTYSLTGVNPANGTWRDWSDTTWWDPATGYPSTIGDVANIGISWSYNGNRGLTIDADTQILQLLVGYSDSTTNGYGGVGLSSLTSNTLSIGNISTDGYLAVGSTIGNKAAQGNLGLGLATTSSMLTVNLYGGSFDVASRNKDSVINNLSLTGTVELGQYVTLNIGTATKRSEWNIAYTFSKDSYPMKGSVTDTGGATVNAYLTTLRIASAPADATGGNNTTTSTGALDLALSNVGVFDISGDVEVGRGRKGAGGTSSNLTGNWIMGDADVSIGGDLLVGEIADYDKTTGSATFNKTRVSVDGDLFIGAHGNIDVTIDGISAGISLIDTSNLTILADNGYTMLFKDPVDPEAPYYGFSWEGDHLSTIQGLIAASKMSWTNETSYSIGAYYDTLSDFTYVGIIPEPSTVVLFLGGMIMGGWVLLQRRKAR